MASRKSQHTEVYDNHFWIGLLGHMTFVAEKSRKGMRIHLWLNVNDSL